MEPLESKAPHVLIFPLPAQGHVNSVLNLAQLLSLAGLNITFLNTDHNHNRLVLDTNILHRFACFPGIQFKTIPDGLPDDHPRAGERFREIFDSIKLVMMMPKNSPVRCTILAFLAVAYKREQHINTFRRHRCGADQTPSEG